MSKTPASLIEKLKSQVRIISNFPREGVSFKDITPLLESGQHFRAAISLLCDELSPELPAQSDKIAAVEARGFLIAAPVAQHLGLGLAIVRKKGKLPFTTIETEYDLEYGKEILTMHIDAIKPGEKVLIVDDVLATGGTAKAAANLVSQLGGEVAGFAFLIEIASLGGRKALDHPNVCSLLVYDE